MNICFQISGIEGGGVAMVVRLLAGELLKLGNKISFISLQEGVFANEMRQLGRMEVLDIPLINNTAWYMGPVRLPGMWLLWKNYQTIRKAQDGVISVLEKIEPDVILGNGASSAALLARTARAMGIGVIICLHEIGAITNDLCSLRARIAARLFNMTNGMVAVSAGALARYERFLNVPCRAIYNCPQPMERDEQFADQFRQAYGIPTNATVIGGAGRLVHAKGHHILIDAVSQLVRDGRDVYCLIAGSPPGTLEGTEYKNHLQELAKQEYLHGRVILPGFMAMDKFLSVADIFCHTFIGHEGLGLTVLEAMRAGLPVIASNIGGPTEIIKKPNQGILINPGESVLLAKNIKFLLDNPEYSKMLQKNGQARILEKFNYSNWTSQWIKFLSYVLQKDAL